MLIHSPSIGFQGIIPPYNHPDGTRVHPLRQNISPAKVTKYRAEVKAGAEKLGRGYNGVTYRVNGAPGGGERALKIHKGDKAKVVKNPQQEVEKLDLLYELLKHHGKDALGKSQVGLAAFQPRNGQQHILSTIVPGQSPDPIKNPLTKAALKQLIAHVIVLDQGTPQHGRFMHYDLGGSNINTTKSGAGIFDYEYLGSQKIEDALQKGLKAKSQEPSPCNAGDTFFMDSNLRNVEFRLLFPYLKEHVVKHKLPTSEAKKLLMDYLLLKAQYHRAMAEHYSTLFKRPPVGLNGHTALYKTSMADVAKSEKAHAALLFDVNGIIPEDIAKTELRKMQLAYLVFTTGPFCSDGKYNAEQVGRILNTAQVEFDSRLKTAQIKHDKNREIYYTNAKMTLDVYSPSLTAASNKPQSKRYLPDLYQFLYP